MFQAIKTTQKYHLRIIHMGIKLNVSYFRVKKRF